MVSAESSFRKEERLYAGMAELADAQDSGSCRSNSVQVQVLLPAPNEKKTNTRNVLRSFFFRSEQVVPRRLRFAYFTRACMKEISRDVLS